MTVIGVGRGSRRLRRRPAAATPERPALRRRLRQQRNRGVLFVDLSVTNLFNSRYRDFMSRYKEFARAAGLKVSLDL
jgi:hypothetical protein